MNNYILKNENAIYYECGYSNDNCIYLNFNEDSFFITDARYTIEAKKVIKKATIIECSNLAQEAIKVIKEAKIKAISYDSSDFSVNLFNQLTSQLNIEFVNAENFSKIKRSIKTQKEIEYLKKASKLGKDGFKKFAKYIQNSGKNQSENILNFKAVEYLTQTGAYKTSFTPIVAINQNSAKPHATPTNKLLKKGDLLLVDAGVKYKRYCSDRTCTSYVDFKNFNFKREQKFKNAKHQKIYDITLKAQEYAIKHARSGMSAKEIDFLARNIIDKAGYGKYFVHSTGHGVGLDIHEFPFINSKNDLIIEDNMVFTIEPGIYLENEFGVRIEDTVVMQEGRAIIL